MASSRPVSRGQEVFSNSNVRDMFIGFIKDSCSEYREEKNGLIGTTLDSIANITYNNPRGVEIFANEEMITILSQLFVNYPNHIMKIGRVIIQLNVQVQVTERLASIA